MATLAARIQLYNANYFCNMLLSFTSWCRSPWRWRKRCRNMSEQYESVLARITVAFVWCHECTTQLTDPSHGPTPLFADSVGPRLTATTARPTQSYSEPLGLTFESSRSYRQAIAYGTLTPIIVLQRNVSWPGSIRLKVHSYEKFVRYISSSQGLLTKGEVVTQTNTGKLH